MAAKDRRKSIKPTSADDSPLPRQRPEGWDERLRLVGDARFVAVEWSGRDDPSWPLPMKRRDDP
jgi:hypothetical protein